MFTGIITDVGEIIQLEKKGDLRARIKTNYDAKGIAFGASIACDGICLTAVDFGDNWFDVEISSETVSKTIIGSGLWEISHKVNLERSLKVGDELGGHIVSGHVDGIAKVSSIKDEEFNATIFQYINGLLQKSLIFLNFIDLEPPLAGMTTIYLFLI